MLENLETLIELHKQGTMSKASHVLRISQSAVSKRIAALEDHHGARLVMKSGRNVILTEEALKLVERLSPLLAELRAAISERGEAQEKKILLGVSESILSSWGAVKLEEVFRKTDFQVEYHCHRSPLVIEKVEAGLYDIGLCSGKIASPRSLLSESLAPEELVLVAQSPQAFKVKKPSTDILSIEKTSATWKSIQAEIAGRNLNPVKVVESFFSIAQLAKAGHGVGLVPIGVAEALGIKKNCIMPLKPKLFRPVQLVYKKSKLERPGFRELIEGLKRVGR